MNDETTPANQRHGVRASRPTLRTVCRSRPGAGQEMQPSQAPAPRGDTSYGPVNRDENLVQLEQKMKSAKPEIEDRQQQLLEQRYDLSNSAAAGVTMSGGKPLQDAVRVKLPSGMTWDKLATTSPDKIRSRRNPLSCLGLRMPLKSS